MFIVSSMTYIKVPEGKRGDDHGSGASVFPITAVEDKSWAGVLTKTALHGLKQLVKKLRGSSNS